MKFSHGKGSFGFKKLLELSCILDICLRLSSIDEVVSRHCKLRKTGVTVIIIRLLSLVCKEIALSELNQVAGFCLLL